MPEKPPLTADFCLHVVVNSTPKPSRFNPVLGASGQTLFDLGVVDATSSQVFVQAVKARIFPWHIDDTSVASTPPTTLQAAAVAVMNNAF
jgi:hypothetical protein